MRKLMSRVISQRAANRHEDFVKLWSSAMWVLAALYLAIHSIH